MKQVFSNTKSTSGAARAPGPPIAPWARLAAWLLLVAAAALLWSRAPLLNWAGLQLHPPVVAEPGATPFPLAPSQTPAQLLAHGLIALLSPSTIGKLQLGVLGAVGLLAAELCLLGLLPAIQARSEQHMPRVLLRVRALPSAGDPTADVALLRSLHTLVPARPWAALVGRSPWLALTLHGRLGEPVELGVAIAAPTEEELRQLIDAVRAAILGHAPGALVEVVPDPLLALAKVASVLARRSFRLSGPAELPLRTLADAESDPLGAQASALQPTDVSYIELYLALRPLRGWALTEGWRAAGLRRLQKLQQKRTLALSPDARRLETRLAAPAFAAELRVLVLAREPSTRYKAEAALHRVTDTLSRSSERTGPWRQGIVASGGRVSAVAGSAGQRLLRDLAARRPHLFVLPRLLLPLPARRPPLILTVDELCALWHLPTTKLGKLLSVQTCRHIPAPLHAFVPPVRRSLPHRDGWIALGLAHMPDGRLCEVGLTISDLRYVLHITAGMGAGKSRFLANVCIQLNRSGYCLMDGKGDDKGGLYTFALRLIPLADERRVALLDPRDSRWPVGINPLAGLDLSQPGAVDQVVANVFGLFARIDPETWGGAQGMRDFLDKALRLVLAGEEHPTLANVKQALLDGDYRVRLLPRCQNRDVVDYWQQIFPRLAESQKASRDALLRRFDKLLSADLLRLMLTQPQPRINFGRAIEQRAFLVVPIPNVALGDLAGVYGMLLFQQLLRAAFARPGNDQSRVDYPLMIDEVQVLVAEAANEDLETAFSRLRSFAVPLLIAHQARDQLKTLISLIDINAENRVILKTREPDASAYARQYGYAEIAASDIINQDPAKEQYAVLRCGGMPAGPFSMAPLPWPEPLDERFPDYDGQPWQSIPVSDSPDPKLDRLIAQFAYEETPSDELNRRADQLSRMPDDMFQVLFERWEALRTSHLSYINANPACIPDKVERIRWRSRLQYALPYVLAEALYRRARPEITPEAPTEGKRRGPTSAGGARSQSQDVAAAEPPPFTQADRPPPHTPRPNSPLFPQDDDEG